MMLLGTSCGLSDPHHNVDGECLNDCGHTISTSDGGSCSMVVTVRYNSYNGGREFSRKNPFGNERVGTTFELDVYNYYKSSII